MIRWAPLSGHERARRIYRYLLVLGIGWVIILCLALAIFVLSPRVYSSGFTMILPGAGPSSSVNLETLGQASSSTTSPFGDQSLSPTENYKKLIQSYRFRGHVADHMGFDIADTPAPRIRLANQTKLIYISVTARSATTAEQLAQSWLDAFETQIDALRNEEQIVREMAYKAALQTFENAVETSRVQIITFQTKYGLISIEQFQVLVQHSEILKLDVNKAKISADVADSEISRLSMLLGLSPDRAAMLLILQSDPVFQSLYTSYSEVENAHAALVRMFGANHPERRAATVKQAGIYASLNARGQALLGFEAFQTLSIGQYAANTERSKLTASLVQAAAIKAGAHQRHLSLQTQLEETLHRVAALTAPAAELGGLLRDHQIAETVFASALARIDTNRTDQFASYPLTQIIERPALPSAPITPSKKLISLVTLGVLILYTIGLALLWIRLPLIRALLKTV